MMPDKEWLIRAPKYGFEWTGSLVAVWEAAYDPITDDYLPSEKSAAELLSMWADIVAEKYPDGYVPLHWYVESPGHGKFEAMPFQPGTGQDFLTHYDWPEDPDTGELLNWLTLPVRDKLWRPGRANKGGFLQEATGWKPTILQPTVHAPGLLGAAGF